MMTKKWHPPTVKPIFPGTPAAIVLAVDQNYLPYLSVCLSSLAAQADPKYHYDICVLHDGQLRTTPDDWRWLMRPNLSLRFIKLDLAAYPFDFKAHLTSYYTIATYYRFFVPEVFTDYQRVLYLDTDMLVLSDVQELLRFDLGDNLLGIGANPPFVLELDEKYRRYVEETLRVPPERYSCAGLLLFDLEKLRHVRFLPQCLHELERLGRPSLVDQDVINCLYHGQSLILPTEWNVIWEPFLTTFKDNFARLSPSSQARWRQYRVIAEHAKIIHYSSAVKPWRASEEFLADQWWAVARQTPYASFLEEQLANA